jgi:hypothetical protein
MNPTLSKIAEDAHKSDQPHRNRSVSREISLPQILDLAGNYLLNRIKKTGAAHHSHRGARYLFP